MADKKGYAQPQQELQEEDTPLIAENQEQKREPKAAIEEQKKEEEEEKDDPNVQDVFGNGQLTIKYLEHKGEGARPVKGELVTVRYVARKQRDGKIFAKSPDKLPYFEFILGDNDVISAWDFGVALMHIGEKALLTTAPRFAYGEFGNKAYGIGPDETLEYVIEVISSEEVNMDNLPVSKRKDLGIRKKERGNELYAQNDIDSAKKCYQKAFDFCRKIEMPKHSDDFNPKEDKIDLVNDDPELKGLAVKCLTNLALMLAKLDQDVDALNICNIGLDIEPKNVKLLYRKGQVLAKIHEFSEAIRILTLANSLAASVTDIKELLNATKKKAEKVKEREKKTYQNMFQDHRGKDDRDTTTTTDNNNNNNATDNNDSNNKKTKKSGWLLSLFKNSKIRLGVFLSFVVVIIAIGLSISSVKSLLSI